MSSEARERALMRFWRFCVGVLSLLIPTSGADTAGSSSLRLPVPSSVVPASPIPLILRNCRRFIKSGQVRYDRSGISHPQRVGITTLYICLSSHEVDSGASRKGVGRTDGKNGGVRRGSRKAKGVTSGDA